MNRVKKIISLDIRFLILILPLFLASCKKEIKQNYKNQEILSQTRLYDRNARRCRIDSISARGYYWELRWCFKYNSHADPMLVIPSVIATGSPQLEFRYDSRHRLTDYIGAYKIRGFEFWYRFNYDKSGRIAGDTQWVLGIYGANPSRANNISRSIYSYDDQGRIIKEAKKFIKPDLPVYNINYTYDANGNLIRTGVIYDNKENLHRTNKIWQLLARDYSINNPRTGMTYNRFNLPTSFNLPYPDILYFIGEISITHSNISYDCKDKDVDEEKEDRE